ncbi:MAG: hypothetical protein HN948_07535 [Clostridia bacterium]|jgi:hypothetical protein|nr:hypothetical protein [Clostridia bacterium]MBT7122846.1 hypothetical protein [Clostridia bacterium]
MKRVLIVIVLVLVVLSSSALAEDNAVALEASSVADGQSDVLVDVVIVLEFSNNVVNAAVAQNNASSIALRSGGQGVPVYIEMADDQIEPEMKRTIIVRPAEILEEGASYKLIISGALSGKNGNTLGQDITISFTTAQSETSGFRYWWLLIIIAAVAAVGITAIRNRRRDKSK